jgi:hypothetical protein
MLESLLALCLLLFLNSFELNLGSLFCFALLFNFQGPVAPFREALDYIITHPENCQPLFLFFFSFFQHSFGTRFFRFLF